MAGVTGTRRALVALGAVAMVAVTGACGGDGAAAPPADAGTDPTETPAAPDAGTGTEPASSTITGVPNLCEVVTLDDVTAAMGPGMIVSQEGAEDGSCVYGTDPTSGDVRVVYVSGYLVSEVGSARDYANILDGQSAAFTEGSDADPEAALRGEGGAARPVDGVGDEAYATGGEGAELLVVRFGELIVTFAVTGSDRPVLDVAAELAGSAGGRL